MIKEISEENYLTPHINWYQTINKVYLTVNEIDLAKPKIEIFFKKMTVKTQNKQGKKFKFDIDFFSDIYKEIKIDDSGRFLRLIVTKKEHQYWPRLYREKESFNWIHIDSVNYIDEDDDDEIIEDYNYNVNEFDCEINEDIVNLIVDKHYKKATTSNTSNSIFSKSGFTDKSQETSL